MTKTNNQSPCIINATQLATDWNCQAQIIQGDKKVWVPARPLGYDSLASRLKLAYMVFRGRADALVWDGQ